MTSDAYIDLIIFRTLGAAATFTMKEKVSDSEILVAFMSAKENAKKPITDDERLQIARFREESELADKTKAALAKGDLLEAHYWASKLRLYHIETTDLSRFDYEKRKKWKEARDAEEARIKAVEPLLKMEGR